MGKITKDKPVAVSQPGAVVEITAEGFKSISEEQKIEVRPLTILAGANSSGKSSMIQPLLLLKQTLEAPYDAGPIMLNGPNVKFTSADELLSRIGKGQSFDTFRVGMRLNSGDWFLSRFRKEHTTGFRIQSMEIPWTQGKLSLRPEMSQAEILQTGITQGLNFSKREGQWQVARDRCFIGPVWVEKMGTGTGTIRGARPGAVWEVIIPHIIHLPALRGNPERTYAVTATGPTYPGTFEKYTASLISQWASERKDEKLQALNEDLRRLALTGGVWPHRVNDVQIELHVGRFPDTPPDQPEDRVNIADVGVGVSQTLPVLVALHAAKHPALVYVEQPETHLHPRAQTALAEVLADAVKRGARVVVETHSSLLLLGVQALVAQGKMEPDKVKLHWFMRDEEGRTIVHSGELDKAGRFRDWPQDFDDVTLRAQKEYLDAADKRLFAQ